MELSIKKRWMLFMMGICIICIGTILVYHFYQKNNQPILSKGIFVMNQIEDSELLQHAFVGEFHGYIH